MIFKISKQQLNWYYLGNMQQREIWLVTLFLSRKTFHAKQVVLSSPMKLGHVVPFCLLVTFLLVIMRSRCKSPFVFGLVVLTCILIGLHPHHTRTCVPPCLYAYHTYISPDSPREMKDTGIGRCSMHFRFHSTENGDRMCIVRW